MWEGPEDLADILAGFYEGLESELDEKKGKVRAKVNPVEIVKRAEKGIMDVFFIGMYCTEFRFLFLYFG